MNSKNQLKLIQDEINQRVEAGESQSKIAKFCGVSSAYISQIVNGQTAKMKPQTLVDIAHKLGINSQDWNIVGTTNYNIIHELCDDARQNSRMMAISAYTGSGKTTALKDYQRKNSNSVYYVLMDALMTRKRMLKSIQRAMGLQPQASIEDALINICEALNSTPNSLLILDDVGKLSDTNMRVIQIIYDNIEHRSGIVLSGTEYLKTHINKQAEKDRLGFRELRSRIQFWQKLMPPSPPEIIGMLSHNGIENESILIHISKNAREYRYVRNVATNLKIASANGLSMSIQTLEKLKISYN